MLCHVRSRAEQPILHPTALLIIIRGTAAPGDACACNTYHRGYVRADIDLVNKCAYLLFKAFQAAIDQIRAYNRVRCTKWTCFTVATVNKTCQNKLSPECGIQYDPRRGALEHNSFYLLGS